MERKRKLSLIEFANASHEAWVKQEKDRAEENARHQQAVSRLNRELYYEDPALCLAIDGQQRATLVLNKIQDKLRFQTRGSAEYAKAYSALQAADRKFALANAEAKAKHSVALAAENQRHESNMVAIHKEYEATMYQYQ